MAEDKEGQEEKFVVTEDVESGSVTVTVGDDVPAKKGIQEEAGDKGAARAQDDEHPAGAEDDEDAKDQGLQTQLAAAGTDEERDQIRTRRRQERKQKKERARARDLTKDRKIETLERTVGELTERLGTVENRGFAADVARVNEGIEQADAAEREAKEAMKQATASQNGEAMAEAQELWYEARSRKEKLGQIKVRLDRAAAAEARDGGGGASRTEQPRRGGERQRPRVDPDVQQHATDWMRRHSWYDPNGQNRDSRIVLALDAELTDDGYNPRTPEYWEELDERARGYLPHRYTEVRSGQQREDPPARRGPVTTVGSGKSGSGGKRPESFTLSADRVQAIKDAGMWDDAPKRDKMIRSYREFDRLNPTGAKK